MRRRGGNRDGEVEFTDREWDALEVLIAEQLVQVERQVDAVSGDGRGDPCCSGAEKRETVPEPIEVGTVWTLAESFSSITPVAVGAFHCQTVDLLSLSGQFAGSMPMREFLAKYVRLPYRREV